MSNPRRTPVTRSDGAALTLKTNMVLRKAATFHSPTSPSDPAPFKPPSLPRRSNTSLDDVIDAHRRRVALTLGSIDRTLAAPPAAAGETSPSSRKFFRDDSIPVPRGFLGHAVAMSPDADADRRAPRSPRQSLRRSARHHDSDSGLGSSIASTGDKSKASFGASAITRSAAAGEKLPGLSPRATSRIFEHTLKPLLARPAYKDFHPLILQCPKKIQDRQIVCLRDVEKTLLLAAPEKAKVAGLYLDFCLTSIACIQATVEYLSDREQTRPRDPPYTNGYFIDLVDQIQQYARELADAKRTNTSAGQDAMDVDPSDEIKLHGGIAINGRPAELVRIKKDGTAFSLATGQPVEDLDDESKAGIRFKRSASQQLEDEEEIMRSMARRKKNAPPELYAPKQCREPGCNKEFKRPCDLTKHEKTHSRPWKCPVPTCKYHEYGWPTEKEMDRHHNDKHSSAPPMFECQFRPCSYTSKRESNCKQHMEKAHGWTYVRTKTNGKKSGSNNNTPSSAAQPTPHLANLPTPSSDHSTGVATPPDEPYAMFNNLDFPAYEQFPSFQLPQEIQLDYSPIDNATPSTDSGLDNNSAYQDIGQDFQLFDDIYSAHVQLSGQLPTPIHHPYDTKGLDQQLAAFAAAEMCQPQPALHISPIGQGNAMLYTPSSMAEVDEGFEEFHGNGGSGADFLLFPPSDVNKQTGFDNLFGEIPSIAAGYPQPSSQAFMQMDWAQQVFTDYNTQQ